MDLFTLYHQSQNPDCSIVLFQEHLRLLIAHYNMHSIPDLYNYVSVVYISLPYFVLIALLPVLIRSQDWVTTLEFEILSVQQQEGTLDCGLFSIANVVEVCLGNNPENVPYDQNKMRSHLKECFNAGVLNPLPRGSLEYIPRPTHC